MYVQKRGSKYRFFERYKVNGEVKTVSVTLDRDTPQSRRKAEEMLRAKMPVPREAMTFATLRQYYIDEQKRTTKMTTWTRNEGTLRKIGDKLDAVKVQDLTSGTIRRALMELSEKPVTLNEYRARLRALIRWAYQNSYIDSTACIDRIKRWDAPSAREKIKGKYLEKDELKAVIAAAGDYTGAVIEFLALSGLRIGEVIALNKEDVTAKTISVTKNYDYLHDIVTTPKTPDSVREVAVQPELAACIRKINRISAQNKLISGTKDDIFIVNPYGGRLSYINFARTFRELTEKHAGKKLSVHALRHTHTSLLAEAGVPLETISRRLGHHDSKITREIYLHVTKNTAENDRKIINTVSLL